MKFLINVELDGYEDVVEYELACIDAVSNAMNDYCHADVDILWKESLDDTGRL